MEAGITTIAAWGYGLTGLIYTFLVIYLATAWQPDRRGFPLLLAAASSALWGWASFAFVLTGKALFLGGSLLADILRFGGWSFFLLALLQPEKRPPAPAPAPRPTWRLSAIALSLLVLGLAAYFMLLLGINFVIPPRRLALLDSLMLTAFQLALIEQLYRNAPVDWRWSIKPLCVGLGAAFLFDFYLYSDALLFGRLDIDAYSIRGCVHAMVVPLLVIATIRSQNWKTRIALSKQVALQSVSLIVIGIYLLFMAAAGYYVRYFGGEWGRALQLVLLFAGLLFLGVLALSGSMRAKLRVLVGKHFFSYRYDYREEWLRFTQSLSSPDGFSEMGRHVIQGLADMVESPAGALWLKDASGRFFAQSACWNTAVSTATEPTDGAFCRFITDSGWIINLEEYRATPHRYERLRMPAWLLDMPNAWLVVPLVAGNALTGFVVLTTARTQIDVNWEVNDLLKTAGRQAGAFLGQMQATEALLEVRKFDAFNRMSAFVVHDLKNIVAQLALMLKNAERHHDNPEFQQDMLMTVGHAVERMRQLMMQLREGTTPIDSPRGIDLGDVIRRIQTLKAGQGRQLEVSLGDKVVAKGHEDRIERVIGHIVQNALDATESGGRVWVKLEKQATHAMVEVGDSGHGMTPEFVRERLFKPFQTTKPAGMGIGAYESFQYVHELGGQVSVDSTINVGTRVSLLLPLFEPVAEPAGRIAQKEFE